ncbi:MAG TPA: DegT/DnrJ/EryC1/StrS family aminotransferase [Candidatus Peribacteria bacterium]|nr:DegT/DnrJ/EryC1/StrS family aminotransferase [Candidatus Peribacteria bacterium]
MPAISIPLVRSTFFHEQDTRKKLAEFVLNTPFLSMGKHCLEFEKTFAALQERRFAVLVCNGSAANLGLIQALINLRRLKRGDKVGVSAVTWATNVMPLMQLGLVPVAVDCSVDNLNVTSAELAKHIKGLKAMFITNALGLCGDIEVIRELCDKHNVLLIEDNCESLGTRYKGTLLGNYGEASTFSFFVGHHLSTIEGGMICTDDEELHEMLVMVRAHGWDRNVSEATRTALRAKHKVDDFRAKYTFYESAYNLRPTEITGFLGALQLPLLNGTIDRRLENFKHFQAAVAKKPEWYHPLKADHIERLSNFAMPVVTKSPEILAAAVKRFTDAGVENRPIIAGNIQEHPFWTKEYSSPLCQQAHMIHTHGLYFPNNPDLTPDEVKRLCALVTGE